MGVKFDQLNKDVNGTGDTADVAVPYVGVGYFIQLEIMSENEDDPTKKVHKGYWQFGFTADYEYINDNLRKLVDGKLNHNEGILSLYSSIVVEGHFGVDFTYSSSLSHFQSVQTYYVAFSFRP